MPMNNYPTRIFDNFFTHEEIQLLNNLITEHCKSPDRTVTSHSGTYYSIGQEAEELVSKKIADKFDKNLILNISMYDTHSPAFPHPDIDAADPANAAYTIIIPLDNYNANTIVFNEIVEYTQSHADFISRSVAYDPSRIDMEFYNKHLSHMRLEDLTMLSIEEIYPWTKGSMIVFYRYKLHCSDNFIKNGLINKKGLVIWSLLKPQP
jgi:hypothetical protein